MSTGKELERLQAFDIKKVFYKKNPKLARFVPGFIYNYLKHVLRQDEVNKFLEKHGDKHDIEFIDASIKDFNVTLSAEGEENLDPEKKYIFVANHPIGGFDGFILIKYVDKHYKMYKFLVNDILLNLINIKDLFLPINKHGKQGLEAAKKIDETFRSDCQILTCPAGLVSRKIKGQVMDLPWQKSFIMKSIKFQRDVIPVYISGHNTKFFYRLGKLRKFFGIKTNIEMFYLIDETWKHRNKKFVIKFGKAIAWQTFDKSRKPVEWAKWVKEQVYALGGVNNVPL